MHSWPFSPVTNESSQAVNALNVELLSLTSHFFPCRASFACCLSWAQHTAGISNSFSWASWALCFSSEGRHTSSHAWPQTVGWKKCMFHSLSVSMICLMVLWELVSDMLWIFFCVLFKPFLSSPHNNSFQVLRVGLHEIIWRAKSGPDLARGPYVWYTWHTATTTTVCGTICERLQLLHFITDDIPMMKVLIT